MADEAQQLLDRELFYAPHKCRDASPADRLLQKDIPGAQNKWIIAMQLRGYVRYVEVDFCPWCGEALRKLTPEKREREERHEG